MKICMFTNTYLPHVGGVANSVAAFSHDLRKMGHDLLIVAPVYEDGESNPADDDHVLRLPAVQNFNGSDFSLRLPVPFVVDERLDEFEPDIIHSHHPYLLGDTALRAARQRKRPLVFTHHTLYENYTHYVPADSKSLRRFVINLSTEYANLCTSVVAPSRSVADLIRRRGVTRPIREIPTGVDVEFFAGGNREKARGKMGLSENDIVIGHLGRLAPEKNLEYLAEATAGCLAANTRACFLVVGSGPSEEKIREIFQGRGLGERLIMAGQMKGRDLADIYTAMDIFVFASHSETQGMVLTEAMAAGKPVVALDASGAREVVRDGGNGLLLPAKAEIQEFSLALAELIGDKDRLDGFRQAALETAREFSRENSARKMADLYRFLLDENEKSELDSDRQPWDAVVERLKVEWELITRKTVAVVEALSTEEEKPIIE